MVRDSRPARLRLIASARRRAVASLGGVLLACAAACVTNPPPQYPPPQYPASQPPPGPGASSIPAEPAQPGTPPAEVVPIDPVKEMPANTLTTNAMLSFDQEATVMIDARSDIFSAGMQKPDEGRGGKLPSMNTLANGGGVIQFTKVVGKAGCMADAVFGSDGGDCAGGNTDLQSAGPIAGIVAHDRTLFLVGVFLGPKLAKTPERLDFSPGKQGIAFAELAPALNQVFFIGDGKAGTGTGALQTFKVPAGATHLYLGYADGFGFQGTPGAYGDNKGGLSVTLVQKAK
jgi:hypothetical protein